MVIILVYSRTCKSGSFWINFGGRNNIVQIVRKLIEKITVHDEKVTVAFKSGLEIDVKI